MNAELPPWVRYRALLDLEMRTSDDSEVQAALSDMLADPRVRALLDDVAAWPGIVLNSHRSANQTFHTLEFLSELGVPAELPEISFALDRILDGMDEDGIPRLPMTYPEHFGGSGKEIACWALCDAPTLLLCLLRFDRGDDPRVRKGIESLVALVRDNGWPCAVSPEIGKFRGPGRKEDPCPYATLIMLRLLAAFPDVDASAAASAGVEALLDCWDRSRDRHPYIFYMGTDFRKLKAPFLWYDILHVAEVLSFFSRARDDPRFASMLAVVREKALPDGSYLSESVYQPYRIWDFGQKKVPSPWISFLVSRLEARIGSKC